ncbi:ABC transporter type 1, transmembrane domain-containing protein [Lentinula edodes]|nr:ABC transporter type 1, transmembrane domain-containing protein [Lentinula edodes]
MPPHNIPLHLRPSEHQGVLSLSGLQAQPNMLRVPSTRSFTGSSELVKPGTLSRFLPSGPSVTASSFRKVVALAKPERKPLTTTVGLLVLSSAVTMFIPFTIGKLINVFSSVNTQIPLGLSIWQASGVLLFLFSAGAAANAGHVSHEDVRTTDSSATTVTQDLSDGLRAFVMSSVVLGAMFYPSPTLTTLMLCVVPPVSFGVVGSLILYSMVATSNAFPTGTQEATGETYKHATESLSALRTIQAYNAQRQEEQKFPEKVINV